MKLMLIYLCVVFALTIGVRLGERPIVGLFFGHGTAILAALRNTNGEFAAQIGQVWKMRGVSGACPADNGNISRSQTGGFGIGRFVPPLVVI